MDEQSTRKAIVDRVLEVYPHALKILFFGSRAKGVCHPESDYDLLVVTESPLSPARRAAPLYLALRGLGRPFDILVVTPEEFSRNLGWRSSVIHTAAMEGEPLYEAA